MKDIYSKVQKSLVRFMGDFATANNFTLGVETLDGHADDSTLPDGDLIGYAGLSMEVDGQIHVVNVMIGIITYNDQNLTRLSNMISKLYDRLQPEEKIDMFKDDPNHVMGFLKVIDGTRVMPVSGNIARPLQYIQVNFVTSLVEN